MREGLTTNLDGCFEFEEDWLFHKDLSGHLAQGGDILLFDFHIFPAWMNHRVDDRIDVKLARHVVSFINY